MPRPDAAVTVDERAPTPPFRQIFEQIRALIERGDVAAGDTLPPIRQLAGDLGVAPNTVARAYADLKADGWIEGDERRRNRIAAAAPSAAKMSRSEALREAVGACFATLKSRGYSAPEIAAELSRHLKLLEPAGFSEPRQAAARNGVRIG